MASWMKRERSLSEESPSQSPGKKPRLNYDVHSLAGSSITSSRVVLNPADSDLDFNIEGNGLQGSALYEQGFAYCWSGARANIGITGGKYCFSCKVISAQPVDMEDTPIDQKHLCRVGISRGDDKVGSLGETEHSFGFGGTGKFSNAGKFSTYGEKFNIGDRILCAVDLESKPMASISFAKNGKWLGTARHFNAGPTGLGVSDSPIKDRHWESAVFPHVLLKNVVVQLQFSYEDGLVPQNGYKPWASAIEDGKGLLGPSFSVVCDCELIMMVGLPASGKTTWAEKWVNDHPEKRYILLGTNLALDQMKVPGLLRKQNYGERFDRLMDRATAIFNTLLTRASKTPRNFIIDQTNVYKSARKRKLKPFANFQKIAVVVFPWPQNLKARCEKRFREMGKQVPAEAVNEMLANFVLPMSKDMPGTDEYFDQVIYVELKMIESKRCLDEMKAKMQSGINVSPYSHQSSLQSYNSSNPLRHSHVNVLQPHRSSTHQYLPESSTNFSHSTLGHYDSPALQQYHASPSGGNWQGSYPSQPVLPNMHGNDPSKGRFLPRDDFNHRRSYSGYEHRASAPMGFSERNSSYGTRVEYHTPSNETMDLSPRYTANMNNHHGAPTERYGGPPSASGAPQVDLHTPTQSLPATSIPHGVEKAKLYFCCDGEWVQDDNGWHFTYSAKYGVKLPTNITYQKLLSYAMQKCGIKCSAVGVTKLVHKHDGSHFELTDNADVSGFMELAAQLDSPPTLFVYVNLSMCDEGDDESDDEGDIGGNQLETDSQIQPSYDHTYGFNDYNHGFVLETQQVKEEKDEKEGHIFDMKNQMVIEPQIKFMEEGFVFKTKRSCSQTMPERMKKSVEKSEAEIEELTQRRFQLLTKNEVHVKRMEEDLEEIKRLKREIKYKEGRINRDNIEVYKIVQEITRLQAQVTEKQSWIDQCKALYP